MIIPISNCVTTMTSFVALRSLVTSEWAFIMGRISWPWRAFDWSSLCPAFRQWNISSLHLESLVMPGGWWWGWKLRLRHEERVGCIVDSTACRGWPHGPGQSWLICMPATRRRIAINTLNSNYECNRTDWTCRQKHWTCSLTREATSRARAAFLFNQAIYYLFLRHYYAF